MWAEIHVLYVYITAATLAATTAWIPLEPKPERYQNLSGCYIAELDDVIPYTYSRPSRVDCMEFVCTYNYVTYKSCPEDLPYSWPCEALDGDKSKLFPDCCQQLWCPPRPRGHKVVVAESGGALVLP